LAFAGQFGARLILMHVVAPIPTPDFYSFPLVLENDQVVANCKAHLERIVKDHAVDPGVVEQIIVCLGQPVHEITEVARKHQVDLVIISTHGHTGAAHLLLGSTTERVVRHAHCPVLVVRQHEHEFI
jgi:universal stress protein A